MKILVVVDMQNDFIDGSLGTKEAVAIVDKVRDKVDAYLDAGNPVIYTRDTHSGDYLQTQEGHNLPVIHCLEGTKGWEISDKVYVDGCPVVDKPSFGSLELPGTILETVAALKEVAPTDMEGISRAVMEIESITLVGLCTDICVISNALILKASFPETPVEVDASCCAGVTPESHENALRAMQSCQVKIV